jgi:16S rRNA (guanine527-N7)-methyltransferase
MLIITPTIHHRKSENDRRLNDSTPHFKAISIAEMASASCVHTYAVFFVLFVVTEIQAAFLSGVQRQPSTWSRAQHTTSQLCQQQQYLICSRSTPLHQLYSSTNDDLDQQVTVSSSVNFAMDPESAEAREITARLGLTEEQHEQLARLPALVMEWNERINLVSRRDCNIEVVFGRHVLPSIALAGNEELKDGFKVIDVGTGGGFPGLPLAIAYPKAEFTLVDSVGKKLKAVEEIANELDLTNVRIHHGRAEEMIDDILEGSRHEGAYDVCLGRSVASLPRFCFWISELIKPESGRLLYIIGGDIEDSLLSQADSNLDINEVLKQDGASDKRILTFDQEAVAAIAAASGEVKQKRRKPKARVSRNKQKAKGQWKKRDNKPKERGCDDFKRY